MLNLILKILVVFLFIFSKAVMAHNEWQQDAIINFIDGYEAGNTQLMGITSNTDLNGIKNSAMDDYQLFFLKCQDRQLTLKDVHWGDRRITADFFTTVDGLTSQGSLTLFLNTSSHKLNRIESNHKVYEASQGTSADMAQMADKFTSAVAVGGHAGSEMNPLMAGLGPLGFIAVGGGMVAIRQDLKHNDSLHACIGASRSMGSFGWGAATNNVIAMAGLGPLAIIGGLAAGSMSYQGNYKGDCEEGPVRFKSISRERSGHTLQALNLETPHPEVEPALTLAFKDTRLPFEEALTSKDNNRHPQDEREIFQIEPSLKYFLDKRDMGGAPFWH